MEVIDLYDNSDDHVPLELIEALHGEQFNPPPDDAVLWRYMNLTKFMSLLEDSALWLSRADLLGDRYECSYPEGNHKHLLTLDVQFPDIDREKNPELYEERRREGAEKNKQFLIELAQFAKMTMYVNCWHQNNFESNSMWSTYLKDQDGIALQTTTDRLRKAVNLFPGLLDLTTIKYVDYSTFHFEEYNVFEFVKHKRKMFESDQEVRLIHWTKNYGLSQDVLGITAKANLLMLIERIVVSPNSNKSFLPLVQKILKRYGLDVPVESSELSKEPFS